MFNPLKIILWNIRRSEKDIINIYNTFEQVIQLLTGGKMLNLGYWNEKTNDFLQAQYELCTIIGKFAELSSGNTVLDVGSGFSEPALIWKSEYNFLNISCININLQQLIDSKKILDKTEINHNLQHSQQITKLSRINSSSLALPFLNNSVDRVVSLEAVQHFKPLSIFIQESKRVLKKNGLLIIAVPVTTGKHSTLLFNLGILYFAWMSKQSRLDYIIKTIKEEGFQILDIQSIGSHVYGPLANYYVRDRKLLRKRILTKFPSQLEQFFFKYLLKMKLVSEKKIIDYVLIKCRSGNQEC